MLKINFDENNNTLCPKCNLLSEYIEEGNWCDNCKIIFNTCDKCDVLLILKGWGHECGSNFSEKCDNLYTHKHENETNPKYTISKDDTDALDDNSAYLWYCPSCKEISETNAD